MKLNEIRALVVDDSPRKIEELTARIADVGGSVLATYPDARMAMYEIASPAVLYLANVIFLDDQLSDDRGGLRGADLFGYGLEQRLMHHTYHPTHPGLLAVGCSGNSSSLTAKELLLNIAPDHESLDHMRWQVGLSDHSSQPFDPSLAPVAVQEIAGLA